MCHNILLNRAKNNIHNILIIVPNIQLVKQMINDFTEYQINTKWNIINFSAEQDKKNKKKKLDFVFNTDNNIIISNSQWLMLHRR